MDYIYKWCNSKRTLEGQTVIITGSNTGIGKETALDMYKRGARVIILCRDIEKAKMAKKDILIQAKNEKTGSIVVEKLDLNSLKSVRECAHGILAREEKINILINNAGVMMCPKGTTEDGFETHMATNHFGHALLTLLLLPKILTSAPSKIIFVSSIAHILSNLDLNDINGEDSYYISMRAYSRSKSACILFARALHLKLREHGMNQVNTYSLHPGIVKTQLGRHISNTVINGGTWFFNNILGLIIKSPQCGAQTTIYCAVDEDCDDQSGRYYDNCSVSWTSRHCRDDATALKLWDLTIKILKLENYNPFVNVSLPHKSKI